MRPLCILMLIILMDPSVTELSTEQLQLQKLFVYFGCLVPVYFLSKIGGKIVA